MTAKEELQQIRKLDAQIEHLKGELLELTTKMEGNGGISYTQEGKGSGKAEAPQAKYYRVYNDVIDKLNASLAEYIELRDNLYDRINKLEGRLFDVLYRRYFMYQKWEVIAVEMHYSYRGVLKLHGVALKELSKEYTQVHIE